MTKLTRCEVCGALYSDSGVCFCGVSYTADSSHIPPDCTNYTSSLPCLPTDSAARKNTPIFSGVMKYFPLALAEVARVSKAGNDKHNPGEPLHWAKDKSADHADCIARHLIDSGKIDPEDGMLETAKVAWRSLALLEIELEERRDKSKQ